MTAPRKQGREPRKIGLSSAFFVAGKEKRMNYDGNVVGPRLREIRKSRQMTLDEVSEATGFSISTLTQLEQGGRRMSLSGLYAFMDVYRCDANTLLNIPMNKADHEFDLQLNRLPFDKGEMCKMLLGQLIRILQESGGENDA